MKILLAIIVITLMQRGQGATLAELEAGYQASVLRVDKARLDSASKLGTQYLRALKKVQETLQENADLDRALLVKKEIEAVTNKVWPLAPLDNSLIRDVGRLRETYEKQRLVIEATWSRGISVNSGKMETALADLVTALTKEGKLEKAKAAKERLEKLRANSSVQEARDFSNRVGKSGNAKQAMVLRRSGDGIEVIVNFDAAGKVSMKSPIRNVVERTGGRKERGQTTARTLGEFVGGENIDSKDPWESSKLTASDGTLSLLRDSHGVKHKRVKHKDGEHLELTIPPNSKGCYFYLEGGLVTGRGAGTFEITAEYFIPGTNKQLNGFTMRHGNSDGQRLGREFSQLDKWVTETQRAVSANDNGKIRCDFKGVENFILAQGDQIWLKSLTVRHVRFSAYLVESFAKSGAATVSEFDAAKQEVFVQNGMFAEEK